MTSTAGARAQFGAETDDDGRLVRLVNNESPDILRMLNAEWDARGDASLDLHPEDLREEIDAVNDGAYRDVNDGEVPGVAETVNFDHIKRHYHLTHGSINPTGIVPKGPALDLSLPHGRG